VDLDLIAKLKTVQEVDANIKQKDVVARFGIIVSAMSKLAKNHEKI